MSDHGSNVVFVFPWSDTCSVQTSMNIILTIRKGVS